MVIRRLCDFFFFFFFFAVVVADLEPRRQRLFAASSATQTLDRARQESFERLLWIHPRLYFCGLTGRRKPEAKIHLVQTAKQDIDEKKKIKLNGQRLKSRNERHLSSQPLKANYSKWQRGGLTADWLCCCPLRFYQSVYHWLYCSLGDAAVLTRHNKRSQIAPNVLFSSLVWFKSVCLSNCFPVILSLSFYFKRTSTFRYS